MHQRRPFCGFLGYFRLRRGWLGFGRLLPGIVPLLTALTLALGGRSPAYAQATLTAEAGLQGYIRAQEWFPVRVTLTNQGPPARVEVLARIEPGLGTVQEYRIPERELRSGANEVHTLYVRAPVYYGGEPLTLDLLKDGRVINTVKPQPQVVPESDPLVLGIGGSESSLKLLTTVTLPHTIPGLAAAGNGSPRPPGVEVAVQDASHTPDRWQGLIAASMIVLGDVSERDFSPEQASALRDYVTAGGTLVVTGGPNWSRLTTPFFRDLLPVRVTGGATLTSAAGLRRLSAALNPPPALPFAVCQASVFPQGKVEAEQEGVSLVVSRRRGCGRVVYIAFDPSARPFQGWGGAGELWKALLLSGPPRSLVAAVSSADEGSAANAFNSGGDASLRLEDAPYSIPELDIPAFYVVALFLLAYIIVLVPVNYFFLKARDRKEYAWLTTPGIVLIFSAGAYGIGYAFKGGRTLVVQASLIEAYAGQDAGPSLTYSGLFSPRKTGYDVQFAGDTAGQPQGAAALFTETGERQGIPIRFTQDDAQKVDQFDVDMWAMRVLRADGITRLGKGFGGRFKRQGYSISGSIRNDSPYDLSDCTLLYPEKALHVDSLPEGRDTPVSGSASASSPGALPSALLAEVSGDREERRLKQSILRPLCAGPVVWHAADYPVLVGWTAGQTAPLRVDGRKPRNVSETLMVIHLGHE